MLISIHCLSNSIDPKGEQYFVGIFFKNAKTAVAKIPDVTSGNTGSIELGVGNLTDYSSIITCPRLLNSKMNIQIIVF